MIYIFGFLVFFQVTCVKFKILKKICNLDILHTKLKNYIVRTKEEQKIKYEINVIILCRYIMHTL